eukprot:NODE_655_length_4980_cov_0.331899.p2 type:complete len:218 gc:universal NODE_655_length_4980_cov_0.331899:428-1081(+)
MVTWSFITVYRLLWVSDYLLEIMSTRKINTSYRVPFLYGNFTIQLHKPSPENPELHTHRWTLFVRGVNGEDISYYVSKVEFKLHESFVDPIRTIAEPPFELTETGWGEFAVGMKVYFVDPVEKPISLSHRLALFEHNDLPNTLKIERYRGGVKSEYYDEFVFQDPTTDMCRILEANIHKSLPILENVDSFYTKELEDKLMTELDEAEIEILAELEAK